MWKNDFEGDECQLFLLLTTRKAGICGCYLSLYGRNWNGLPCVWRHSIGEPSHEMFSIRYRVNAYPFGRKKVLGTGRLLSSLKTRRSKRPVGWCDGW
jgi:hypothetical protein